MNLADPLECPPEWGLWCREKLSSRRLALSFAKMTDDPQLWRSMLIALVALTIVFGALLLLVGLYRRGYASGHARSDRSSILEEVRHAAGCGCCIAARCIYHRTVVG